MNAIGTTTRLSGSIIDTWRQVVVGDKAYPAMAMFDEASVLHVPGRSGLAGEYQGGEAILGFLDRLSGLTDDTLRFHPTRIVESRCYVILCGRLHAERRGSIFSMEAAHVLEIADGVARQIWMFHLYEDALEELSGL